MAKPHQTSLSDNLTEENGSNSSDGIKSEASENRHGFSVLTATIFIVGELVGGGILSLPHAVSKTGWGGMALMVYCCFCAGFGGLLLARSWIILEERYPRYRNSLTRKPYATIGYHSFGSAMRLIQSVFVSILIDVTMIAATVVFFLLISNMATLVTHSFLPLSLCQWIPIVAAILIIPLWLGSPADFWPIAYTTMISSVLGSLLLIFLLGKVLSDEGMSENFTKPTLIGFFGTFGMMSFAFGGSAAFPNFQNDMKEKKKFPFAVIVAFILLLGLYLPVAGIGYAAFGSETDIDIFVNLNKHPNQFINIMTKIIQTLFLVHCLTVVPILINPVFLDLEDYLRIPKPFNWKRCLFRTVLVVLMAILALTFPRFGQIQELIGSSTMALLTFVLPVFFYIKLCKDSKLNAEWPVRKCSLTTKLLSVLIFLTGVICAAASNYNTIINWKPLESSCYAGII